MWEQALVESFPSVQSRLLPVSKIVKLKIFDLTLFFSSILTVSSYMPLDILLQWFFHCIKKEWTCHSQKTQNSDTIHLFSFFLGCISCYLSCFCNCNQRFHKSLPNYNNYNNITFSFCQLLFNDPENIYNFRCAIPNIIDLAERTHSQVPICSHKNYIILKFH